MFGNKKNKIEEQIKDVFSQVAEQREIFETSVATVEAGEKRIYTDICQVMETTNDLAGHAMLNIEEESNLIHELDEFSRELKGAVDEYGQLKELIDLQLEASTALVEENKHFTSPAKYLTEAPGAMKQTCQSYEEQLDVMAEYGRKMSVMALNAAIEAGRIGESGKQFVAVSEEIRQTALTYEKAAAEMKEEVVKSREKIAELEDTIHHLVSLMKENNVGTARLMKKSQETSKMIQSSSMRDFSDDMIEIRGKVVAMRNLDEEIAKCAERSKIQLSDIQEEVQNQKKDVTELESDLSHLFDIAEEQLK